jgi:hypothetical protein
MPAPVSPHSKQELMEYLLETMIANIGYPVGMGMAPHPGTIRKMAEHALKLATAEEPTT